MSFKYSTLCFLSQAVGGRRGNYPRTTTKKVNIIDNSCGVKGQRKSRDLVALFCNWDLKLPLQYVYLLKVNKIRHINNTILV